MYLLIMALYVFLLGAFLLPDAPNYMTVVFILMGIGFNELINEEG